jgi:hypothetical protein
LSPAGLTRRQRGRRCRRTSRLSLTSRSVSDPICHRANSRPL